MSQVSGENVQNVQNVRERVLQLAREIEGMSREAVPPETFFQEFINRVVAAVGAPAGAVWMRNGSNRLSLVAGARLDQIGFPSNRQSLISNEKLLAEVVSTGEACTRSPHDETDVELPTEHLLVFSALHRGKDCVGVVQLFQRPDAPNEARPGYLQFLEQMCGYASRYLEGKHVGEDEPEVAGRFWTDFEQFVLRMQRSLDSQEIAATAASDGRLVLGCDRLSVAVRRGRRTSIRAVSGQTAVNPRANLIRAMVVLCRKVMAMGEPLLYTGKIDDIAPQIEKPLANFVQESTSRMVKLVPMFEPEPLVRGETDDETRRRSKTRCRRPIGCLVAEQVSESEPARQLEERLEMIADHVAASLTNAQRHERIFLLPLWKSVGRTLEWFHGRRLAAAVAVLLLLAAGISALILVPWDYRVTAKGKLMPVRQVAIFAPRTAQVLPPEIEGGERVTSGQVLLHMKDEELDEKINDAENGVLQHENNLTALYARLRKLLNPTENRDSDQAEQDRNESLKLETEYDQTGLELKAAREKLAILHDRAAELVVRSTIDGVVADFQIEQLLNNRVVQAGQLLFHVMEDQADWHLELQIEEKRMGHIQRARSRLEQDNGSTALPVEYMLVTKLDETFEGSLGTIATIAEPHPELGNVVEAFVIPTELSRLPTRSIGAEVRAKISCGERSLGYVLFGDVVEFVRKYFWL